VEANSTAGQGSRRAVAPSGDDDDDDDDMIDDDDCSSNSIRVIRKRWKGHVARTVERRDSCRVLVGKPKGKPHLKDPGIDGRILKWIFK
jgi:hypothetical protein